ncbi:bifunctional proline dehydrogenase/L-glutamate gamma-semialdehyde dehydrogenase PutA [Candidatus Carsonella ruddii]|uniref:Bifunctional protein PutA n=1 Tax=Carsonella ruddii TaxID=114186 RepID=A0A2K8K4J7_CARRU|nr:bifunctional proline dehydrogenase/L-glutamate gamma-semialdehyde dehydrogenase PutA [Candidatus Carsonella ruddii]ATX33519.1 bifunctional proline dehydrogenase/L-glutamate gamma-semialdehyde dehydrogenase PutA [Candidatus Carsonella ruddii]
MTYNFLLNIVSKYYLIDENIYLFNILKNCSFSNDFFDNVETFSYSLINESRKNTNLDNIDNILNIYNLSTKEGIQMMCLAESLLRIPDYFTSNSFIKDKLSFEEWKYYYSSEYWKIIFYNMIIDFVSNFFYKKNVNNYNLIIFVFRKIIVFFSNYVMKNIGKKFVYSSNENSAIKKSLSDKNIYSFDMLGEAALTYYDAKKFFNQYLKIINNISNSYLGLNIDRIPTVSIKLSALNPKYSFSNRQIVYRDLIPILKILVIGVKKANSSLTIDAEECDRMELNLYLFSEIFYTKYCLYWNSFGLVIQAYSKRALPALYWINKIAYDKQTKIPVRLVKGAYWDYEVKNAQFLNLNMYPVYIKKFCTDLSYLFCSMYLLSKCCKNNILPQFATHNIQTISFITILGKDRKLEFQKLYGMGDVVYNSLKKLKVIVCREYAPIGKYKELLPYLVRRLLENGANSSFVNKVVNKNTNMKKILINSLFIKNDKYNKKLPFSIDLFGGKRDIFNFYNLNISCHFYVFFKKIIIFDKKNYIANSFNNKNKKIISISPSNKFFINGIVYHDKCINNSIKILKQSFKFWKLISIDKKVIFIKKFISLLQKNFIELIILCCKEAGKTILDSVSDIKEAIDFCKYYTNQAYNICKISYLPNYTGENNIYFIEGKGIISTISPWNFPIAIFCGQTISALITGNVVLAKPAESTSLIAFKIIQLLYKSGIPVSVCQIILGKGSFIGNLISFHKDIYGVIFTGSNKIANLINKNLIMRDNRPIHKLIAETGGLNTMIADSSTLIEQLVIDILESSFKSCGQRCSALRLLYLNESIYLTTIKILFECLNNLKIGDPLDLETDIGPIITNRNLNNLKKYLKSIKNDKKFNNTELPINGNFIKPTIIRVNGINDLKSEQFGPILHVAIYKNEQLNDIIKDINNVEYGLTLGIHSRNESFYKYLANKLNIGNIYINRNTIGAMVGMQPFGGCNLSGTGPKAGGGNYINSLINEKTVTINIAAQGGNIELLNS